MIDHSGSFLVVDVKTVHFEIVKYISLEQILPKLPSWSMESCIRQQPANLWPFWIFCKSKKKNSSFLAGLNVVSVHTSLERICPGTETESGGTTAS
jgi:hypothetical protein